MIFRSVFGLRLFFRILWKSHWYVMFDLRRRPHRTSVNVYFHGDGTVPHCALTPESTSTLVRKHGVYWAQSAVTHANWHRFRIFRQLRTSISHQRKPSFSLDFSWTYCGWCSMNWRDGMTTVVCVWTNKLDESSTKRTDLLTFGLDSEKSWARNQPILTELTEYKAVNSTWQKNCRW
jgi:hypothetical protein